MSSSPLSLGKLAIFHRIAVPFPTTPRQHDLLNRDKRQPATSLWTKTHGKPPRTHGARATHKAPFSAATRDVTRPLPKRACAAHALSPSPSQSHKTTWFLCPRPLSRYSLPSSSPAGDGKKEEKKEGRRREGKKLGALSDVNPGARALFPKKPTSGPAQLSAAQQREGAALPRKGGKGEEGQEKKNLEFSSRASQNSEVPHETRLRLRRDRNTESPRART